MGRSGLAVRCADSSFPIPDSPFYCPDRHTPRPRPSVPLNSAMTRTFLATLEFDGTRFVGWQRQREGRTVQEELEKVLERLTGGAIRAHAAGRTDAGVHAMGMSVSFALPARWTPDSLQRALNALLPDDCYVAGVRETRDGFHARTCAMEREYEYRIGTDADAHSPFRRPYEWALDLPLDAASLLRTAGRLLGEHDFLAFSVKGSFRPHTRCRVRLAMCWALSICAAMS